MKKTIMMLMILLLAACVSLLSCSKSDGKREEKVDDSSTTTEAATDSSTAVTTTVTTALVIGEVLPNEEFVADGTTLYTNDNLPSEYHSSDFDGDGLSNIDEVQCNTNMYIADTDGDGITDGDEKKQTLTDPAKYSTRDDGLSDLDWWFSQGEGFSAGWASSNESDYRVYLANASDRMYAITKVSTDVFDELETITEAYQITNFSGKAALNCSGYSDSVRNSISIYIHENGSTQLADTVIENSMIIFNVESGDIFVAVYTSGS